jgi:predicted NodU family carbamoyl transferase
MDEQVSDAIKRIKALDEQYRKSEEAFETENATADARKADIANLTRRAASRAARVAKLEAELAAMAADASEASSAAGLAVAGGVQPAGIAIGRNASGTSSTIRCQAA